MWGVASRLCAPLRHPGGATGFRLDGEGGSLVLASDHEAGDERFDAALAAFAGRADVLLHDAQYTDDQVRGAQAGWGHSACLAAAEAARRAEVGHLVLTSHDPERSDDDVDALVARVRARFASTEAARPGLTFPL